MEEKRVPLTGDGGDRSTFEVEGWSVSEEPPTAVSILEGSGGQRLITPSPRVGPRSKDGFWGLMVAESILSLPLFPVSGREGASDWQRMVPGVLCARRRHVAYCLGRPRRCDGDLSTCCLHHSSNRKGSNTTWAFCPPATYLQPAPGELA